MLRSQLTPQQVAAVDYIVSSPAGVVIADTGVGKTIISLTAIADTGRKVIVAAPPKVIAGWPKEAAKWGHTQHLRLTLLKGTPEQRAALLKQPADVLLISLNSLDWLLQQKHGADFIIVDELSKAAGKQTAKLKNKPCDTITKRIGLTATPVSENFQKLFGMVRIIDKGQALGRSQQTYLQKHFYPTDFKGYNWQLRPGHDRLILDQIRHLIHDVNTAKADTLPPLYTEEYEFDMPANTRKVYDKMREEMLLEGTDADVVAVNMAVLSSKLRQIASGFAIAEDKTVTVYDSERAAALADLMAELNAPALIIYEYDHQRKQIEAALPCTFASVYGGNRNEAGIEAFKRGELGALVAQQNTLSHGVDGLQLAAHHIVFYHPLWSNDSTEQAIGRIWRQGQRHAVTVTTLVCADTLDDLVLQRLGDKAQHMRAFLHHLRT